MIHHNILAAVGSTPLIAINRIFSKPGVTLAVKLESRNPGGSIKDRVALAMIEAAEAQGLLTPDKTIIEATSGNTGIGLAMVCAVKGYKLRLLMPASASEERKRIMRAYGADIVLTPGHCGTDGAIEEAYRLAREEPDAYVLMDQFNNPASIEAHYRSTAVELWEATQGRLTHVVATLGTSGTAMGLVKRLKEYSSAVTVVAVEPHPGHKIQGLKNMRESYPPGIYNKRALDAVVAIDDETAFEMCRRLAREEGVFAGMSSGAALAAAVSLAETLDSGLVVAILPDSGERYLSTSLFAQPPKRGVAVMDVASGEKIHPAAAGGVIGLFTVGPSLDQPGDPEAWRRILMLDVLGRHLDLHGAQVKLAAGLADLDDRTMNAAHAGKLSQKDYSARARGQIDELARALGLSPNFSFVPASRGADRLLGLADTLTRKGFAYERLRSLYFDVARDKRYGELLHTDLSKLSLGKTVDLEAYDKDNPKDFTLLKRASLQDLKKGEVLQTAWGNVRPSWFLQMAATALDGLPRLSVFMAGEAHSFPHMENLRAIWTLGASVSPAAWMVCRGVTGLTDIAAPGLPFLALRLWLLSCSYRKPLQYSPAGLAMWLKNWRKLQETAALLSEAVSSKGKAGPEAQRENAKLAQALAEAVEDDLSLSRFWPVLFDFCRAANTMLSLGRLDGASAASMLVALRQAGAVLGVLDETMLPVAAAAWPEAVARLAGERAKARQNQDFIRADAIREEIAALG
ncbi:MAG: cysteine synthase, partial [Desulfovibrionaceae bacterium]|nr:cysteine synthase [Desulfovibrionaceae bacterium]